jgi:hypothetical protein
MEEENYQQVEPAERRRAECERAKKFCVGDKG